MGRTSNVRSRLRLRSRLRSRLRKKRTSPPVKKPTTYRKVQKLDNLTEVLRNGLRQAARGMMRFANFTDLKPALDSNNIQLTIPPQLDFEVFTSASTYINPDGGFDERNLYNDELDYWSEIGRAEEYLKLTRLNELSGKGMSSKELTILIEEDALQAITFASEATIGVVTNEEAFQAILNRLRLMKKWLGRDRNKIDAFEIDLGNSLMI